MRLRITLPVLALVLAGTAAAATPGFTPKKAAGNWRGTWTNETFGSTGPASIVMKALNNNKRLTFNADFGGNVFGCQDPPPEKGGLTKGAGANHWNARGFVIKRRSSAFGTMTITYLHARKTLTGNGVNPTCNNGLRWRLSGKFSGRSFTGTVNITLPDGTPAVSKLNLTR